MNVLDARVINTIYGLEIYSDKLENIEIKAVYVPSSNFPFYEVRFGIDYLHLRKGKYYDRQRNYFGISMNHDFSSVTIIETEVESLFAVKNEDEREATKKLLGEWLVKTNNYKESINQLISKVKKENSISEDNEENIKMINFLEKLLELTTEDINNATIEKQARSLSYTKQLISK